MTHMAKARVGVVIATRGRPVELLSVLAAIKAQSTPPVRVVVCDSSDPTCSRENLRVVSQSGLPGHYIYSQVKSLTHQKNMALRELLKDSCVEYVQVLDDDTIPDDCHLEKLAGVLQAQEEVVGASGVTRPRLEPRERRRWERMILSAAGLSGEPGTVTSSGVGIPVAFDQVQPVRVQWLFGCSMWRRQVFERHQYYEGFFGSAICEDIEFATRVSEYGAFVVVPSAILSEACTTAGRPNSFIHSYMYTRNRLQVMGNLGDRSSFPSYILSLFVLAVASIRSRRYVYQTIKGMTLGIVDAARRAPGRSN